MRLCSGNVSGSVLLSVLETMAMDAIFRYFLCLHPAFNLKCAFFIYWTNDRTKACDSYYRCFRPRRYCWEFCSHHRLARSRSAIFNVNPTLMCRKLNQMAIYKSLISKTKFSVIVGVPISIFFPFHFIFFIRSPRPDRWCDVIIKHKYECSRSALQCEKRFSILRITRVFNRCQWVVSRRIRQMGESGRV